jgi:hypothetical protein
MAADHGWLGPAGSSSGEALALFGLWKELKMLYWTSLDCDLHRVLRTY